jgi:hypothetical protein
MSSEELLTAGLRAMAANDRHMEAPARVESNLRAAFRSQAAGAAGVPRVPVWRWVLASAAMIAVALLLNGGRQPDITARAVAAVAQEQGEFEGFIELPNAARLTDTEEVNVVRVEVPRSAMLALGLEVSAERAAELVPADVMLGPDGLARAVRFLDSEGLN